MKYTRELLLEVVANNLRRIRFKLGLTQEQMAELAGVSRSHYSQWECNRQQAPIYCLLNLSEALEIDLNDIVKKR